MRRITELVTVVVTLALLVTLVFVLGFRPAADLKSDGYFRGQTSNSTQAAFALSAGRTTTKPTGYVAFGQPNGDKPRFINIIPFGAGTAATTADYKLWSVTACVSPTGGVDDYDLQLFCSGTATLSATAGVGSSGILTTDKVCDVLTVTAGSYGTAISTAFGSTTPNVYSGGVGATLFVPDFGPAHGFVIEWDMTGATSMNYLYSIGV